MNFFISQYLNALSLRKHWLIYALIPPVLYLLIVALSPVKFSISQKLIVSESGNAQQTKSVSERIDYILSRPENIFLRDHVVGLLQKEVILNAILPTENWNQLTDQQKDYIFKNMVANSMTVKKLKDNEILLTYNGKNSSLGNKFVAFYAKQIKDTIENFYKKNPWVSIFNDNSKESKSNRFIGAVKLGDTIHTDKQRVFWDESRGRPFFTLLFISLLLILIVIAIIERLNPRIISVRQAANYLQVPVLGVLPDLKLFEYNEKS